MFMGGESPAEGGFDCTGLVWYVYNQMSDVDISLSQAGRSKSALANAGTKITDISNFLPRDIVQFDYPHVGIYIGNNTIIEARKSGTRVNYRAINSYSQVSYAIRLSSVTQGQITNVTEEKRPDKPAFKDVNDSYTTSTGATFYWNNVSNATTYGLILDKYNDASNSYEWYESYWNINSGYNQALPAGKVHFPYVNNYYKGTFNDIREGQWYTDSVANAYKLGLMKGDSPTSFNPHGDVTIAEAITMAARIHCIYTTKKENFVQSGKWYQFSSRIIPKA